MDDSLSSAVVSGQVTIRGIPHGQLVACLIDVADIDKPAHAQISRNELVRKGSGRLGGIADFYAVAIDWKETESHVDRMLAPAIINPPSEQQVRRAIKSSLERNPQRRSRSEHLAEIRRGLPGVTEDKYEAAKKWAIEQGIMSADWRSPDGYPQALKSINRGDNRGKKQRAANCS